MLTTRYSPGILLVARYLRTYYLDFFELVACEQLANKGGGIEFPTRSDCGVYLARLDRMESWNSRPRSTFKHTGLL